MTFKRFEELEALLEFSIIKEQKPWHDAPFWKLCKHITISLWKWFLDNLFAILGFYTLFSFAAGRILCPWSLLHKPVMLVNVPYLKECFIAFLGLSSPNVVNIIKIIGEQIVKIISAMKNESSEV